MTERSVRRPLPAVSKAYRTPVTPVGPRVHPASFTAVPVPAPSVSITTTIRLGTASAPGAMSETGHPAGSDNGPQPEAPASSTPTAPQGAMEPSA
jgi:hypothetical protein